MFNAVSTILGNLSASIEHAAEACSSIDGELTNHVAKLNFRAKLVTFAKRFPRECRVLLSNECAIEAFDTYRFWRCRCYVTPSDHNTKDYERALEELNALTALIWGCRDHGFKWDELSDAIGYELKLKKNEWSYRNTLFIQDSECERHVTDYAPIDID